MNKQTTDKALPSGCVEGYYWMSDATKPTVIQQADSVPGFLQTLDPTANPFVVEARLYDCRTRESLAIKYVDGRYIVNSRKVSEEIDDVRNRRYDHISLKRFLANRMDGRRLLFFQYWEEMPDPLCLDMKVLRPSDLVFVGFENINHQNSKK